MGTVTTRRLTVAERRRRLVELGKEIFSDRAYDEISTDELSRRAGVSKGLLYHYFPCKRDYYVATIQAVAEELLANTQPPPGSDGPARVRAALAGFVSFLEDNPKLFRALVRGGIGSDPQVEAIVEEVRQKSIERVLEVMGARRASRRVASLLYGWVGFVEFLCLKWVDNRCFERAELIELIAGALEPAARELAKYPPSSKGKARS